MSEANIAVAIAQPIITAHSRRKAVADSSPASSATASAMPSVAPMRLIVWFTPLPDPSWLGGRSCMAALLNDA